VITVQDEGPVPEEPFLYRASIARAGDRIAQPREAPARLCRMAVLLPLNSSTYLPEQRLPGLNSQSPPPNSDFVHNRMNMDICPESSLSLSGDVGKNRGCGRV
jgi:hypothetical protein